MQFVSNSIRVHVPPHDSNKNTLLIMFHMNVQKKEGKKITKLRFFFPTFEKRGTMLLCFLLVHVETRKKLLLLPFLNRE
jgi:hypothetical protein